ncbi:MAG: hypothetical protein EHM28_06705 [Spirochaetaceae bacterium]|nr:MAG: hypothetical protein EHM28_06705 [Spirochaetaceae bacterium]
MGADILLRITLTFPDTAKAKTFLQTELNEAPKKLRAPFDDELPGRPVVEVFEEWGNMGALDLQAGGKRWNLAGLFGKDAFNDLAPELASLLHHAGLEGAKGEALAVGIEFEDGFRLTLEDGLKIKRLTKAEAVSIQQEPRFRKAVLALMEQE